jgi:hypothetical protein
MGNSLTWVHTGLVELLYRLWVCIAFIGYICDIHGSGLFGDGEAFMEAHNRT